jgi:hypothetical protein
VLARRELPHSSRHLRGYQPGHPTLTMAVRVGTIYDSHMAKAAFDLTVVGDATRAKVTVEKALLDRKFRVIWTDDWNAVAVRSNKVVNILAGAMSHFMKVMISLHAGGEPGQTIICLQKGSSGALGGFPGVARTTKDLYNLRDQLSGIFQEAGVLVSPTQT